MFLYDRYPSTDAAVKRLTSKVRWENMKSLCKLSIEHYSTRLGLQSQSFHKTILWVTLNAIMNK